MVDHQNGHAGAARRSAQPRSNGHDGRDRRTGSQESDGNGVVPMTKSITKRNADAATKVGARPTPAGAATPALNPAPTPPTAGAATAPTAPTAGAATAPTAGAATAPTATTAPNATPTTAPTATGAAGTVNTQHTLIQEDPLAALLNEAQAAVSDGANTLRDVRERYRSAYLDRVGRWETMRVASAASPTSAAAKAAEADHAMVGREVGLERSVLNRIDLAAKSLENAWLFLAREDSSLVSDPQGPPSAADAQMRIVEAQEAERSRLAREVHDGPAQALSNAIFQVEVVQRLLDRDERLARAELKQLREVLTRELRGVRAYLSQLRPPLLADLGLSGAVHEAADQIATALSVPVHVELAEGVDSLPETVEVVTLRIVQEALQNARKHAKPRSIRITMTQEAGTWTVEIRDDGKGFEANDPPAGGRRHFGLQFMRERAELIGARFDVRSSPDLGTAVRMTIPPGAMGMPIPGEER
jgi:two-component system sensor histidine kinase DegS